MPIYEYRCSACGHELEVIQKISDPLLKDCPECGKPALEKLLSASAFRLKGGGWYETDFKTGNKKNIAGDSGKKGSESDSGGKTDAGKKEAAGKNDGGKSGSASAGTGSSS